MKKAVPLIVFIIFIGSIAIVGFFGMKIAFVEESIYVREVRFINQEIIAEGDRRVVYLYYTPVNGYFEYQLQWEVLDDNATNKNVRFVYDTTQENIEIVCSNTVNGLVRFSARKGLTIRIIPDDGGGGKEDEIEIIFIRG